MVNEKITDDFISNLLRDAGIDYVYAYDAIDEYFPKNESNGI